MAVVWGDTTTMRNSSSVDAQYALEIASWLLYRLTGERYPGTSTTTETYRAAGADTGGGACEPSGSRSGKQSARSLRLRHAPVLSVGAVIADGLAETPADYRVERYTTLRRRDGRPLPLGGDGMTITYTHGLNPPAAGVHAAGLLADQFVYSWCGSDECRLPERVTSISRQGVSYTVLDPQEYVRDGRTGIYLVDLFIHSANPSGAKLRARVFTPDGPRWVG